jgi:hypothetical protein
MAWIAFALLCCASCSAAEGSFPSKSSGNPAAFPSVQEQVRGGVEHAHMELSSPWELITQPISCPPQYAALGDPHAVWRMESTNLLASFTIRDLYCKVSLWGGL